MEIEIYSNKPIHSWRQYLIEKSLDAVIGIGSDSLIIDWNPQAESVFGWSHDEAIGKDIAQLIIPAEFRKAHYRGIKKFLKTHVGAILNQRTELPALHKDGHQFPVELTVSDIQTGGGILFYAFIRDITERKKMEEALKDAIREKDEFISICSHELKTPLTSMRLQFQMAKRMADKKNPVVFTEEETLKRINLALRNLERMNSLIENMLDVTRLPSGKVNYEMEPIEINNLIEGVYEQVKEQLEEESIDFKINFLDEKIFVEGDHYRLEQVLLNLINNAIKYGNHSPIEVIAEVIDENISVSICDQGPGIEEGDRQKIFDRFTRLATKGNVPGLGLGLYISFNIIKAHGGTIKLESEVGVGTKFSVILPRYQIH